MNQYLYEIREYNSGVPLPIPLAPEKWGPDLNHLGKPAVRPPSSLPACPSQPTSAQPIAQSTSAHASKSTQVKELEQVCIRHAKCLPIKKEHNEKGNKDCKNLSCLSVRPSHASLIFVISIVFTQQSQTQLTHLMVLTLLYISFHLKVLCALWRHIMYCRVTPKGESERG